jgi:hypothetical protein
MIRKSGQESHCPQLLQVRYAMQVPVQVSSSQHSVSPGVQAGADAQEHAPQAQLPEQVCVPYVLQASVAFGAQTP